MIRLKIRCTLLALAGMALTLSPASVRAVELWGIMPATNRIVRVDPLTGGVLSGFTPPGGVLTPAQEYGGLTIAERGAALLYQNPVANPTNLYRLNPDTGALLSTHFMPASPTPQFRAGLSFASGAGAGGADAIFAINDGAPVQRQDGYGDATLTDHTLPGATFAGALGGDDNGRQFLALGASIVEFSPSAPNVTLNTFPAPAPQTTVLGLAFDGKRIYLSASGGRLWTINPDTGAVLNSVFVSGGNLIGLAARGVPEPNALGLVITAGVACWGQIRRARQSHAKG